MEQIFTRSGGAYSEITLGGYHNDHNIFSAWCEAHDLAWPAPRTENLLALWLEKIDE
jgi:hypothetical protein